MFNTNTTSQFKKYQLSSIVVFLLSALFLATTSFIQAEAGQLSISKQPQQDRNLYRAPREALCTCPTCTCNGGTCPVSVAAGNSVPVTLDCGANNVLTSLNYNIGSTDGSSFKYYTMTPANYDLYKSGLTFYARTDASSDAATTCGTIQNINSGGYGQTVVIAIKCANLIYNCPLKYEISGGCTSTGGGGGNTQTIGAITLSNPSAVNSGKTFSSTARVVDSNGNTVTSALGSVVLSWDGPGTLGGSTTATLSGGVASFSNSITVSSTTSNKLKATYVINGSTYSQSNYVTVQSDSVSIDYTQSWVGTWKVQDGCDGTSCCCLTGTVTVTKTNTNTVFMTGPVKGQCGGSTTMSATVSNIDSDTTLKATMFGNQFTLTRNVNELTVVNENASQCSGRATKTSGAASSQQYSILLMLCLILSIIFVMY